MEPRWAQVEPRWHGQSEIHRFSLGFVEAERGAKLSPDGAKWSQDGAESGQDGPKLDPDSTKSG